MRTLLEKLKPKYREILDNTNLIGISEHLKRELSQERIPIRLTFDAVMSAFLLFKNTNLNIDIIQLSEFFNEN